MNRIEPDTVAEPSYWERARDGSDEEKRSALKALQVDLEVIAKDLSWAGIALRTLGVDDHFISATRGNLAEARRVLDRHTNDHIADSKRRIREAREAQ